MEAAVANAIPPFNATNANVLGPCQLCRSMRKTARVKYARNIGMLVLRQTRRLEANLCKSCASKEFWNFQGMNLLLGPWGVISLIITPIYLVTNTVSYVAAQRELQGAVE
jgi:hypothetical protein